jgi:kynurenine formamidase
MVSELPAAVAGASAERLAILPSMDPHCVPGSLVFGLALSAITACAGTSSAPSPSRSAGWKLDGAHLIDLTHTFDATTIYWPTEASGFQLRSRYDGLTPGGYFYSANVMTAPEHGGTHLDAPIHFAKGRSTTEQIPLTRLVAPAVVIDIRGKASENADALLEPADLDGFEAAHVRIDAGTIVLVMTGWSERWPDRARYLGDDTPGDASHLHFPGVSQAAAEALVQRRVAAVGIDTASIDYGPSTDFMAHRILLGADIPVFENVTALDQLPPRGALVIALPMKIGGGSGGPLRIVAAVPAG